MTSLGPSPKNSEPKGAPLSGATYAENSKGHVPLCAETGSRRGIPLRPVGLDSLAFRLGRFPPAEAGTPYPEDLCGTWVSFGLLAHRNHWVPVLGARAP